MKEYFSKAYNNPFRWRSYLEQINYALDLKPKSVLYVGVGNGLIPNYLSHFCKVETLDIDKKCKPTYLGDVKNISKKINKKYDVIICCQVLEHVSFKYFSQILKQFKKISRKVILSIPHSAWHFRNEFIIGKKAFRSNFSIPIPKKYNGFHKWEIGRDKLTKKRVRKSIKEDFNILIEKGLAYNPYYRFYVLEVKK